MQKCIKCEQYKDLSSFYRSNRCASGYRGTCKLCCNKYSQSQYAREAKNKSFVNEIDALKTPDKEYLNSILSYCDGMLYAKVTRGNVKAGKLLGNDHGGYKRLCILGAHYLVHRIIWKMHHGYDAINIDHINNNRSDNRIENLKEITHKDNARKQIMPINNSSGFIGVSLVKASNKYRSMIGVDGNDIVIGTFSDINEAATAYNDAARKYHGDSGDFKAKINEAALHKKAVEQGEEYFAKIDATKKESK